MQVHQEFVSAGVNRVVGALAWSQGGCVAYGAHHMVAIYDSKEAQVVATMTGHTSMVGCVAWVPHALAGHVASDQVELLVSGSTEGELRVWAVNQRGRADTPWQQLAVLKGHTGPVTGLAFHALPPSPSSPAGSFLMVSTAGDTALHVWECRPMALPAVAEGTDLGSTGIACRHYQQESWTLTSTIPVGTQMQHAVALTHLPGHPDWLLLVTGGTDSRLHLHWRAPGQATFQPALKLPGHDGWIRSLALHHVAPAVAPSEHAPGSGAPTELLIATASQDRYGRIWKVCIEGGGASPAPAGASGSGGQGEEEEEDPMAAIMRYAPRPGFEAAGQCFSVTLESLLIGHEDWVHSVCWQPLSQPDTDVKVPRVPGAAPTPSRTSLCLLSASMDRTMMLWTYEASSGLWMNVASVGDAGAACLGYFGGVFSPDGGSIMAHGFTGAVHLWERQMPAAAGCGARHGSSWIPRHALGGHWDAVTGVAWGCNGACVMSVSADQTARIFTATRAPGGGQGGGHWCEIARPQVHGHDFSCIASLPRGTLAASYAYVSGSEEKVLRVMEGTQAFLDSLKLLQDSSSQADPSQAEGSQPAGDGTRARAFGAAVSALGLTNKMVMEEGAATKNAGVGSGMPGGAYEEGPDFVPNAIPSVVREPPLEEHLAQNTLWPEGHKLYGHGDMLYCCAASRDGAYLASACVAKSEQQAAVWVWDVAGGTWKAVAQLMAHTLTVTQLAWSHKSDLLASCSRDRTFSLFQRLPPLLVSDQSGPAPGAPQPRFRLVHRQKAAHTRVLWGITWSHDDTLLAMGARDNLVKVWGVVTQVTQEASDVSPEAGATPSVQVSPKPLLVLPAFQSAVTAVAWAPCSVSPQQPGSEAEREYLLAVGLEEGHVQMWRVHVAEGGPVSAQCAWQSAQFGTCAGQVNSLAWREDCTGLGPGQLQLAVGSNDHSVRVIRVTL